MTQQDMIWLSKKVIEQQDRIDELERKIASQARTITALSEALAVSSREVPVESLADFHSGHADVWAEITQ